MDPAYALEPLETDDGALAELAGFLRRIWPKVSKFQPEYLRWLYAENPAGQAVGFNVRRDGALVAHLAATPFEARFDGEEVRAVLFVNGSADPAHQGKGLFSEVGRRTLAASREQAGAAAAIGVANGQSVNALVERIGFDRVGVLDARVGVGMPARRSAKDPRFAQRWTPAQRAWRLRCPTVAYAVATGRFVHVPSGYPGIRALLGADDGASRLPQRTPRLSVWFGLDASLDWSRTLTVPLPAALRPSPLNFIFKDLTGRDRRLTRDEARIEGLDFDAY